jgi:hypothetical protein
VYAPVVVVQPVGGLRARDGALVHRVLPVVLAQRFQQPRQLEQAVRDGVEARLAAHRLELGVAHVDGRGLQWG